MVFSKFKPRKFNKKRTYDVVSQPEQFPAAHLGNQVQGHPLANQKRVKLNDGTAMLIDQQNKQIKT